MDAAWNEKEDVKKDTCVRERERAMKGIERGDKNREKGRKDERRGRLMGGRCVACEWT